ncbi:MAG: WYL domain-containing protein [Hyphomicrobiales bacterium]|nr:WYL domain-containing protein [Hyphomicrobiales bacterium]
MRWGIEQRLEFIEFRMFWEGTINRADLVDFFGLSVPQASKDLALYQERAPGNVVYDRRNRRYVASPKFVLRFLDPDPYVYLSQLRAIAEGNTAPHESSIAQLPEADVALTPKRDIDIEVLRRVLEAIREGNSIDVHYQSMNRERPDPIWRRITPHAFGYDGLRWHVRAFCHLDQRFKDFLLPRILGFGSIGKAGAAGEIDWLWHNHFDIIIGPHPKLTESQKTIVAKDYGFSGGSGVLSVRYAMLFYVLKRLGLLGDPEKEDPRRQHIIALNKDDVQTALNKSNNLQVNGVNKQNIISGAAR